MRTPCQSDPELWVSDSPHARAEAIQICRNDCPTKAFAACAKLAKDAPFGVMAGKDYHQIASGNDGRPCAVCGVRNFSHTGHPPRTCRGCVETKVCVGCGVTFARGAQSNAQWDKAQFHDRTCWRREVAA